MKKVLYIALFAMVALLMVGCGKDKDSSYSFEVVLDDYSELRESIVVNVTLKDENEELKNSEIKAELVNKETESVVSTKKVTFDSTDHDAELKFTNLTAETVYVLTIYAGYEGEKVELLVKELQTSNLGTAENPYILKTKDDLTKYLKNDRAAHFELGADIDFGENTGINPLFTSSSAFTGSFDGKGYTIKNYTVADRQDGEYTYINTSTQYYGIFGYIGTTGVVKNVNIENATVYIARKNTMSSSQTLYYGILAGYNSGTVENVNVISSNVYIKSTNRTEKLLTVGGLIGLNTAQGTVANVNVEANIDVVGVIDATVGGVVGTTLNAETVEKEVDGVKTIVANISNAKYDGTINVDITGSNAYDANTVVGGILGRNYRATVENCESSGKIIVKTSYTSLQSPKVVVGGLLGWNINDTAHLTNSKSSVEFNVSVFDIPTEEGEKVELNVGLLVGRNGGSNPAIAKVTNCTYTLAQGAQNVINTVIDARIEVVTGLFGATISTNGVDTNKTTESLEILVQNHVYNEETKLFKIRFSFNILLLL